MSQALNYREPHQWQSGLLALAVHLVFFTLLIFGMRWQAQPPQDFVVEAWANLPVMEVVPPPELSPLVKATPAEVTKTAAPAPAKADIELREKQLARTEQAKVAERELQAKREAAQKAARVAEEERVLSEYAEKIRQDEQARVRSEINAAMAAEEGRYKDMIRGKIQRNIVMPPDVAENAVAEFRVTLLPGGMVMDTVLLKGSGNAAYDNAVERAIFKAQPLPLPADPGLKKEFRVLRLTFSPKAGL